MKYPFATVLLLIVAISFTCSNGFAQTASRGDLLREIKAKQAELQQLENQFLAPTPEDRRAYAEFLSQPNTGLIRLLPRQIYDSETYRNSKTITMRGGGAYYSFTRLTHEYGFGSDIALDSDYLSVGFAGADYGILVNLGEVKTLDELTLEDPRVRSLSDYTPPSKESDARREARKFGPGYINDTGRNRLPLDMGFPNRLPDEMRYPDMFPAGLVYGSRLPVFVNSTYLLRSIGYSTSDVLVAFKVVRRDSDGSVILAWKRLKKYPVPQLALGK